MSTCSAAEIAEKKRIALEKLRSKKAQISSGGGGTETQTSARQIPCASKTVPASVFKPIAATAIQPQLQSSNLYRKITAPQGVENKASAFSNALHSSGNGGTKTQTSARPIPCTSKTVPASVFKPIATPSLQPQLQSSNFYRKTTPPQGVENKASAFLNALKQSSVFTHRKEARDAAHPYQRSVPASSPSVATHPQKPLAQVFVQTVTCKLYLVSVHRFAVHTSGFMAQLIEIFKQVPSKSYDSKTRIWSFSLNDYQLLQQRVATLKPNIVIGIIPKNVINLCLTPIKEFDRSCLASIEPTLAEKLLPFQQEGVCFAIAQHGRAMICDEMGLGKTYQALAIADFYKEDWPLLICTTASTRESWATHVRQLLPNIPLHYIQVLTNQQQFIGDAKVLITSYNMMEKSLSKLNELKFGMLIFDESQTLKNSKAKCTIVADRLSMIAKHVVLLSGTPALSRPLELFSQLQMIDRKFMNYIDFTSRYCDGKQNNFGWDATGQSNLEELNVVLRLKYMIRRVKADVLPELAEKSRETVVLDPALILSSNDTKENLNMFAKSLQGSTGKEKEQILLRFYAETANVKTRAVCAYLKSLVKENIKFIVFAHHRVMMNAISECLNQLKVQFVRIDGSTRNEQRAEYIDTFQKKSACKVAVLSLKACNSGITLTAAEMIIFAELDWNPSTLAQAESRAHRIGQSKAIVCRYLMATKTADDTIWNMLKAKQDVLNRAGLFAENLQEATHTAAATTSNKIEQYLVPDNKVNTSTTAIESPIKTDTNSKQPQALECLKNNNCSIELSKELENLDELFDADDDDAFKDLKF